MVIVTQNQNQKINMAMDMEKKASPVNQDKIKIELTKIKERKKAKIQKLLQKMLMEDMVLIAIQNQKIDMEMKASPVNQDKTELIKIKDKEPSKIPELVLKAQAQVQDKEDMVQTPGQHQKTKINIVKTKTNMVKTKINMEKTKINMVKIKINMVKTNIHMVKVNLTQINLSQEKTEDKKPIQISKITQKVPEESKKLLNISRPQEPEHTKEIKETN